jgi:hypothetical protein
MRQRRKRRFFTAAESAEIWDRWRKGEGLTSIGRVFGKTSSSIFAHICPTGGIMPAARRRSRLALTLAEREEISRGLAHGHSLRRIACSLERAPSLSGELDEKWMLELRRVPCFRRLSSHELDF